MRKVMLHLEENDLKRLIYKAGAVGLTLDDLFTNFANDLIDGSQTNGSDEREFANDWFNRCWFGMFPDKTFLRYLITEDLLESFNESYKSFLFNLQDIDKMKQEIQCGVMCHNDKKYTWKDIVDGSNNPCYSSLEEWENDRKENILDVEAENEFLAEELNTTWNNFTDWTDLTDLDRKAETQKVLDFMCEIKNSDCEGGTDA